ncbi:MAG: hypothetical protein DMF80_13555 [Acidobacteria bacterium]|nr:MAG: hypothetical protein DMF80_13555 [Acidobacteriota bacterium]
MCSAQNFGETRTGRPVARARSIIFGSTPLAWRSISTGRPAREAALKTVFQKSYRPGSPSGMPLSPWVRNVRPLIAGQASSSVRKASRQYAA